ncbi:trypco2 family protein [Streptomyces sp. CB03911]|uniref:trypco2 family protein n=1 Tax=Streptomyces sp. CB03911 TaxID=1804758 RepID=UPI0025712D28|nr:trypco2 family protein [Streptomyces sp. CB03911]
MSIGSSAKFSEGISVCSALLFWMHPGSPFAVEGNAMSGENGSDGQWMDLADAVMLLRDQIVEAQSRVGVTGNSENANKGVLFRLGEINIELGLELVKTRGMNGGLRWSVVSFGGKRENAQKAAHKVNVKLSPHQPGGGDVDVYDDDD